MYVIGTAGHVDHGKSTLVEALTGIDPDRWAEEKEREMTIDLGFAWLTLDPLPEEVGVVDVPGHRDFIENMLAGVGGVDLAMLIVAADEGVMPQTREHLAILDLLQVPRGIVVLTKTDLIDDPDWLELIELDVSEALEGTIFADAPVLSVSAKSGHGLPELKAAIVNALQEAEPRADLGRPRLPVDRVFTVSGFGTIVTGTLIGGSLKIGDTVEVQPAGHTARIRGLQSHQHKLTVARPGRRVAINLTGVDKSDLQRGDVVAPENVVGNTILCDVEYRQLPSAPVPLKHNMEVKLFVGSTEVYARTRVLGQAEIKPGETGWLQLALREPAGIVRGDRFILRRPSPGMTMGGGRILDPHPGRQHRRFKPDTLARLETLAQGTPAELLLQTLQRIEPTSSGKLLQESKMNRPEAEAALEELQATGTVVHLGKQLLSATRYNQLYDQLLNLVEKYHQQYPLRLGMPREELRSRLQIAAAVFNPLVGLMVDEEKVAAPLALVQLPSHSVQFNATQQRNVDNLIQQMRQAGVSSPSVKICKSVVGDDVYAALVDLQTLHPVSNEVVYLSEDFGQWQTRIVAHLEANGSINASQVRDLFDTSRKYAIALLEHLDERRVTRRVGDQRELF